MGSVYRKTSRGKDLGWYAAFTDADGVRRHVATKQPSRRDALVFLAEAEARVRRGLVGVPTPEPAAVLTVADVCQRFVAEYSSPRLKDTARRRAECAAALKRITPLVGSLRVGELSAARLSKARDELFERYAPGSVRVALQTLHGALAWAARTGITKTPPPRIELPPSVYSAEFLDKTEVCRLLAEAAREAPLSLRGGSRQVAVMLALLAGLRRGEVFGLRWCDVDAETGRLTIARSYKTTPKSGKPRHLRLPPALVPVLSEWRRRCPPTVDDLVCPSLYRGVWGMAGRVHDFGLKKLLRDANCKPLRRGWHALRHTFASHFVMQGGSVLTLARILGHSDIKMTMIYAHLAPDFLLEEMARVKF